METFQLLTTRRADLDQFLCPIEVSFVRLELCLCREIPRFRFGQLWPENLCVRLPLTDALSQLDQDARHPTACHRGHADLFVRVWFHGAGHTQQRRRRASARG